MIGDGLGKICVFYDKFYVINGTCVFIVLKTKYVNSDNIIDICGKLNFTTNYIYCTPTNTHSIKK
jgi:hypothetical protein